jgi:phosphotransferase system HPr-like phosphotransfer protein
VQLNAVNAKTANYTLVLADAGDLITMSDSAARTITVPTNTAAAFPIGSLVYLANLNTGAVTIANSAGVTVNAQSGLKVLAAQFSTGTLMKYGTNTWLLTITSRGLG